VVPRKHKYICLIARVSRTCAVEGIGKPGALSRGSLGRLLVSRLAAAEESLGGPGRPVGGLEALEQFTGLHPDNPLGHLELAAAYELADLSSQQVLTFDV
jgi:hypothetical protein